MQDALFVLKSIVGRDVPHRRWSRSRQPVNYAPLLRLFYEPHDLPHILPSVNGPEELAGSLLSLAYLSGPAYSRKLGCETARVTGIFIPCCGLAIGSC